MCEHCRKAELEGKCPSCYQVGTDIEGELVESKLLIKPFFEGEYKECNNEECNVKYYSEHLAYFKKDIIN